MSLVQASSNKILHSHFRRGNAAGALFWHCCETKGRAKIAVLCIKNRFGCQIFSCRYLAGIHQISMHQFMPAEGLVLNSNMGRVRGVKKLSAAPSSQGHAHPDSLGLVFQTRQVPWFHSLSRLSVAMLIRPVGSCKCIINRSQGYSLGPEWVAALAVTRSDKEHSLLWGWCPQQCQVRCKE